MPARPTSVVGSAAPPVPRSPSLSAWVDDEHGAPWATGRGALRAPRVPGGREGTPFVERRSSRLPAGGVRPTTAPGESPAYGDWTKPSGSARVVVTPPEPALPAVPAPLTTAIPDREVAGRRAGTDDLDPADALGRQDRHEDRLDPHDGTDGHADEDGYEPPDRYDGPHRRGPASSPGTGPVLGGRAASRAERQAREEARLAAEAARRKAARRSGQVSLDDDERPRRPRRLLTGLVAVGAVAAAVLGVYTVTTPGAELAGDRSAASSSAPPSSAPTSVPAVTAALPPLDTAPEPVQAAPVTPVRVPVTVLNATDITGLAADISAAIAGNGKGWRTGTPGGYPNGDVAATTVYYTEGDEKQRQAALQLTEQFPQISGPAVRFFQVPAEVQAPGLVVVAAGDWKP